MAASSSVVQSGSFTRREAPAKLTSSVVAASLVACIGSLSFGYLLGYSSPAGQKLQVALKWSDEELSWFNSIAALGALAGSMVGRYVVDKFGRKMTIILSALPSVIGWMMIGVTNSSAPIFVGRVITGFAIGFTSLTVPIYIAEISPAKYRGMLGNSNQLGVTLGFLVAYALGISLSWKWLAIAGGVPPTIMMILMIFMPETPRWLIKNGRIVEANRVLKRLLQVSFEEVEVECENIKSSLGTAEKVSLVEIKKPNIYRPVILSIMLMVFQQFGGTNAVLLYASTVFREAGFSDSNAISIVIGVVQFLATAVSCLIVDKLGRRLLLIFPGLLMSICMIVIGVSSYVSELPKALTLTFVSLFIIGYSLGWGPIPWLVMSEIFPTRVRGFASAVATVVNWLGAFTVVRTYSPLKDILKPYGAYWFYAAVCLASAIYVFFFFPETKGRTLEDIEELFGTPLNLEAPPKGYGAVADDENI